MLFSVEGDSRIEAASRLAAFLREHPGIAWVRNAVEERELEDLYELYFPRRFYFVSDRPEQEIPARLSPEALAREARTLAHRLAGPAGMLLRRSAPADPLSVLPGIIERFQTDEASLRSRDGQLVTPDGRYAIVIAGTASSAFRSGTQTRLLSDIDDAWQTIRRELAAQGRGQDLRLESAGASRFVVSAERRMKRDVYTIAAFTFVGVAALFLTFVGSLRGFLVVSLAPLGGILTATTLGLFVFGELDGLTMAFGASLMGIAIDYSNHLLIHHGLAQPPQPAAAVARRLRASLVLGALTTIASFTGLAVTAFPAFRQMSFFAIVGVSAGLLVTLLLLPGLVDTVPELPARAHRSARWLGARLEALALAPRSRLSWVPALLVAAAALSWPHLEWSDDMSKLTDMDPEVVAQDRRVRERVGSARESRFVIAIAPDPASALAMNDRIHGRLQQAVDEGELEGTRSLHALLWSEELQRRNWRTLSAQPGLAERVDDAFAREGFRPGAFAAFAEALDSPPPPPLRLEDIERSSLGNLLAPYTFELGDETAVVTYLRGLRDEAAVRAAIDGLDGVFFVDQRTFVNEVYGQFRRTTLEQMGVGALMVLALLALRYRAWRPVVAAALPAALVAMSVLALLAATGTPVNLLHVMALIMVTGMGVDYGIFLVDAARREGEAGATMLSLLMSCLTTALVFGALAFSTQPALRAIGVTTGVGVILSYLLAPVALLVTGLGRGGGGRSRDARG